MLCNADYHAPFRPSCAIIQTITHHADGHVIQVARGKLHIRLWTGALHCGIAGHKFGIDSDTLALLHSMPTLPLLWLTSGCWCTGKGLKHTYSSEASAKAKSTQQVDAASLAKARKLSVPVGVLAGVFGSFVGVGGGVLIVPMLTGACKALPQRLLTALRILSFLLA